MQLSAQEDEVHTHLSAAPSQELPTITPEPPGDGGSLEMNAPGSKVASNVCFCISEGDRRSRLQRRASQMQINPSKSKANNGKMMSPVFCAASAH